MKCPKCNGDKGQWDIGNYHWYPCDSCHETGEVDNQPKGKLQSDGMPESIFPKPDRLYMKTFASYDGKYRSWIFDEKQNKDEYLRADKVSELVRQLGSEHLCPLDTCPTCDRMRGMIAALFPEGVESEVKDE